MGLRKSLLALKDQAEMFVTINQQAKKVPQELLIDIAIRTDTADRRMKVVNKLKEKKVFENKIKSVDIKGDIHITTFVKTAPMLKLLGDEERRIGELSKWYGRRREAKKILREDERDFINFCVNLLEEYFCIVREVLGPKWEDPKTYLAATDRGIRAFLRILSSV
jgi:hypothetical protein